ncbi:MAG: hypothetical protein BAJATHORv1_60026 [Candidatus Thorarchaeota archaeon]|nr:MAG: hypothetical protein BAJATHORv1_60026 [Candidatus Thorarchaeota archaeon]
MGLLELFMEMCKIGKALSSEVRCFLLTILEIPLSLSGICDTLEKMGIYRLRRETIYRHLEILTNAGLVEKEYHRTDKILKYTTIKGNMILNLLEGTVEIIGD